VQDSVLSQSSRGRYESTKTREVCFRALLNDSDAELSLSIV